MCEDALCIIQPGGCYAQTPHNSDEWPAIGNERDEIQKRTVLMHRSRQFIWKATPNKNDRLTVESTHKAHM
jgi:hypothetical protein